MPSSRAGLVRAVVAVVAGGLLVLLASGRVWAVTTVHIPGAGASQVSVKGHSVEASLPALAIALLALAAGLIAAKGVLRRIVGLLVVVVGGTALGMSIAGRGAVSSALTAHEVGGLSIPVHGTANGWWVVAAVGGLVATVAGLLAVVRSREWAAMGRKYEVPDGSRAVSAADAPKDPWDVLDRGEDPTE